MPNSYTQIHIQFVFAVKYRRSQIHEPLKDEVYRYITGIIQDGSHKVLAINGMPDHIHILIGMRPTQSVADLMREVKACSSKWLNHKAVFECKFEWQEGYGAFSYSKSQVSQVIRYIENQELHHSTTSFREEYKLFLEKFGIEFDEKYTFHEMLE